MGAAPGCLAHRVEHQGQRSGLRSPSGAVQQVMTVGKRLPDAGVDGVEALLHPSGCKRQGERLPASALPTWSAQVSDLRFAPRPQGCSCPLEVSPIAGGGRGGPAGCQTSCGVLHPGRGRGLGTLNSIYSPCLHLWVSVVKWGGEFTVTWRTNRPAESSSAEHWLCVGFGILL